MQANEASGDVDSASTHNEETVENLHSTTCALDSFTVAPLGSAHGSQDLALYRRRLERLERCYQVLQKELSQELARHLQQSDLLVERVLKRLEARLGTLECNQPKHDLGLAQISGRLKGLEDEVQEQGRYVDTTELRHRQWRSALEQNFHGRHLDLERQIKVCAANWQDAAAADNETARHQAQALSRLERLVDERLASMSKADCDDGKLIGLVTRIEAVENRTSKATSEGGIADISMKVEQLLKELGDTQGRMEEHEVRVVQVRSRLDVLEERHRVLADRAEDIGLETRIGFTQNGIRERIDRVEQRIGELDLAGAGLREDVLQAVTHEYDRLVLGLVSAGNGKSLGGFITDGLTERLLVGGTPVGEGVASMGSNGEDVVVGAATQSTPSAAQREEVDLRAAVQREATHTAVLAVDAALEGLRTQIAKLAARADYAAPPVGSPAGDFIELALRVARCEETTKQCQQAMKELWLEVAVRPSLPESSPMRRATEGPRRREDLLVRRRRASFSAGITSLSQSMPLRHSWSDSDDNASQAGKQRQGLTSYGTESLAAGVPVQVDESLAKRELTGLCDSTCYCRSANGSEAASDEDDNDE